MFINNPQRIELLIDQDKKVILIADDRTIEALDHNVNQFSPTVHMEGKTEDLGKKIEARLRIPADSSPRLKAGRR